MRPLLLSLKPIYADLVFSGLKTAELRRHITKDAEGRDVFIYVSSPERRLRGGFRVDKVWEGTPDVIWEEVKHLAQVDEATFASYYEGRSRAFALSIAQVWEYKYPVSLADLRLKFPSFVVPQSWRYLTPNEHRSFSRMRRLTLGGCSDMEHALARRPEAEHPECQRDGQAVSSSAGHPIFTEAGRRGAGQCLTTTPTA